MPAFDPPIDTSHVATNKAHFGDARYQPSAILQAQRNLWSAMHVIGAVQKTLAQDFLIIGDPFTEHGACYSKILNAEILHPYTPPTLTRFSSSDLFSNAKMLGATLVWEHVDQGESDVREWYKGIGAEAKDGRILFNVHYKDAWEALFHEPVHEAAPKGGIGTSPRWSFEGYCEIFAQKLAQSMGHTYNIEAGPYGAYATEVRKLIEFTSETYVARAYFVNDEWSEGLLAPLWYKQVAGHDISPDIQHYIPKDLLDVPSGIKGLIQSAKQAKKPEWYQRWVRLFGRSAQMPAVPAPLSFGGARGGPPPMPGQGGPPLIGKGGPPPMPSRGGPAPQTGGGAQVLDPVKPFNAAAWATDH